MTLTVDDQHLGTSEVTWLSSGRLSSLRPLPLPTPRRIVVIAPHPDDEIFGAAGLLQSLAGIDIEVIAVSDGEASHPEAVRQGCDLRAVRARESAEAMSRLGLGAVNVTRLGLPDSAVAQHRRQLTDYLGTVLSPGDLCLAPWRNDGHPDHDACGDAAAAAAASTGAALLEYLVWAWHWLDPEDARLPWHQCAVLALSRRQVARKRWATHAFTSQVRPLEADAESALLPAPVLRRFWRPFEVFIDGSRP